jgi:hypothetical protein
MIAEMVNDELARGRHAPRSTAVLLALVVLAWGCSKATPTEPSSSDAGLLVLSFSMSCPNSSAAVFVDGQAVGRVQLPGALSIPVAVGPHTYSVGSSPTVSFEMPPNGRVFFTNAPAPCP